jgi:diadenosine tetraphosphate (Ap4A) HIT family hydrolase
LDFAFSFPEWFCKDLGADTGLAVWRQVEARGEAWLEECSEPFWGRPGKKRPDLPAHLRQTEQEAEAHADSQPKSVFQIGGAGAVGTASLRGMPHLVTLNEAGFSVWPFQRPSQPLVLEIYPRTLTGPVVKSDRAARDRYLAGRFPEMSPTQRQTAAGSEHAFDAAVSALVMARHLDEILALEWPEDEATRLEGRIWTPAGGPDLTSPESEVAWGLEPTTASECPFCAPENEAVVARSDHGLAVSDRYPVTAGHTLIVPKSHVGSIFDLPVRVQQDLWTLVDSVRGLLMREHGPAGFTVGINDGPAAGQTVDHAHIHVIPRYEDDVPDPRGGMRWVVPSKAAYWEE